MNFTMDDSPYENVINEIRTGLTQYNAPFLENIPHSKIAYYATEDNKKLEGLSLRFGVIGYLLSFFGSIVNFERTSWAVNS